MKYSWIFYCFPFLLLAQNKNQMASEKIEKIITSGFYGNTMFVHHEFDEKIPRDTLSYTFYFPKISIKKDTIYLSYLERIDEYGGVIIEKIEQIIPIQCIDEVGMFNFSFGATDRLKPALSYLGFWMLKKDCSKQNTYYLDNALWESQQYTDSDFELHFTDAPFVPKFPVKLSQRKLKKLQKYFKELSNASN